MDRSSGLKATAAALGITLTAWAGYKLVIYAKTQYRRRHLVNKYRELLIPSPEQLHLLKLEFIKQLIDGLQHDVETNGRELLQLPTHVTKLPTGHEVGDVYAIDLGGTNFRVMHAKLAQEKSQVESQDVYQVTIPKEVYTGTGQALFDFLATTLKEFIDKHDTAGSLRHGVEPVVGFCFSFPMKQSALDAGVLLDWTKAFACADVIGQDPVVLLSNALKRAGRPCRIVALLNDTVGVFAAHKYVDPSTAIGVIIGTGTNACYVERASQVTKWQPQGTPLAPGTQTAINIEWGAFDSEHLPRCPEDQLVDEATLHQGRYLFEKMLSGMYLGEAARRILMTIAGDTKLFGDFERYPEASAVFARLAKEGSFSTSHLSAICMDDSPLLLHTSHILADPKCLGCKPSLAPHSTRVVVKEVCELVAQRSAHLVAMALDAILTHSQWDGDRDGQATVAFDGGVYEHFEAYQAMLWRALNRIRGPAECAKLRLTLSKGGSCLGAAVLAAAAVAAKPAQAIAAETPPTASLVAAAVTATTSEPIVLAPPSIITAPNANSSGVTTQSKATAKSAAPHVDVAIASIGVSTPSLLAVPVVPEHSNDGIVLPVVEPAAPAAAPKAMTTNVGEQGDDTDAATNGDDEADDVGDGECANGSTTASPDKPAALGTGTAGGSSKKRKKKEGKK